MEPEKKKDKEHHHHHRDHKKEKKEKNPSSTQSRAAKNTSSAGLNDQWQDKQTMMETLECPVCCDLFKEPLETTCGHAFCEYCLNRWLEQKKTCPLCNENPEPVHPSFSLRAVVAAFRKANFMDDEAEKSSTTPEEEQKIGNDCYKRGDFAEAIEHYSRAMKKKPSDFNLYNNRAQCYIKIKQWPRGLSDSNFAIRLNPASVKAYLRKSQCLRELLQFPEAINSLTNAKRYDKTGEWTQAISVDMALSENMLRTFNNWHSETMRIHNQASNSMPNHPQQPQPQYQQQPHPQPQQQQQRQQPQPQYQQQPHPQPQQQQQQAQNIFNQFFGPSQSQQQAGYPGAQGRQQQQNSGDPAECRNS